MSHQKWRCGYCHEFNQADFVHCNWCAGEPLPNHEYFKRINNNKKQTQIIQLQNNNNNNVITYKYIQEDNVNDSNNLEIEQQFGGNNNTTTDNNNKKSKKIRQKRGKPAAIKHKANDYNEDIVDDEDDIEELMNNNKNENYGGHIQVTSEEKQAIERLKDLGFSMDEAVEAYMVCNKDEASAADYLFHNLELEQGDAQRGGGGASGASGASGVQQRQKQGQRTENKEIDENKDIIYEEDDIDTRMDNKNKYNRINQESNLEIDQNDGIALNNHRKNLRNPKNKEIHRQRKNRNNNNNQNQLEQLNQNNNNNRQQFHAAHVNNIDDSEIKQEAVGHNNNNNKLQKMVRIKLNKPRSKKKGNKKLQGIIIDNNYISINNKNNKNDQNNQSSNLQQIKNNDKPSKGNNKSDGKRKRNTAKSSSSKKPNRQRKRKYETIKVKKSDDWILNEPINIADKLNELNQLKDSMISIIKIEGASKWGPILGQIKAATNRFDTIRNEQPFNEKLKVAAFYNYSIELNIIYSESNMEKYNIFYKSGKGGQYNRFESEFLHNYFDTNRETSLNYKSAEYVQSRFFLQTAKENYMNAEIVKFRKIPNLQQYYSKKIVPAHKETNKKAQLDCVDDQDNNTSRNMLLQIAKKKQYKEQQNDDNNDD